MNKNKTFIQFIISGAALFTIGILMSNRWDRPLLKSAPLNFPSGKFTPPAQPFTLSPFILDAVFDHDGEEIVYSRENEKPPFEVFETSTRFFAAGRGAARVILKTNTLLKRPPHIWLYNDRNHLIDGISELGQNSSTLELPGRGVYRLKVRFRPDEVQQISLRLSLIDKQESFENFAAGSMKEFRFHFLPGQLAKLAKIRKQQEDIFAVPRGERLWTSHPSIKERVFGVVKGGTGGWAICSVGLGGRNTAHSSQGLLSSLDVRVHLGELPYGLSRFKLYLPSSKSNGQDMIFETTLRDIGFFMPHQDHVKVHINGQLNAWMELLENVDTHLFENSQVQEGRIIGYSADGLLESLQNPLFQVTSYYKSGSFPLRESDQISTRFFSDTIREPSMILAAAIAAVYGGNHGLGQVDLRFHENKAEGSYEPIVRDFNAGVLALGYGMDNAFLTSSIIFGNLSPFFRPLVPTLASQFALKSRNQIQYDSFFYWCASPPLLNFFEPDRRASGFMKALSFAGGNWLHSKINQRMAHLNRMKIMNGIRSEPGTESVGNLLRHLPPGFDLSYTPRPLSSSSKRLLHDLRSLDIPPSIDLLRFFQRLDWRNSVIKAFSATSKPLPSPLTSGALDHDALITFLCRLPGTDSEEWIYTIRNYSGNDDAGFALEELGTRVLRPTIYASNGSAVKPSSLQDILLQIFDPNEKIVFLRFHLPKSGQHKMLRPVVNRDKVQYFGPVVLMLPPKEPAARRPANATYLPPSRIAANSLAAHPIRGALVIPIGTTLAVEGAVDLRFEPAACLEIRGDLQFAPGSRLTLRGTRWGGVHFIGNDRLDISHLTVQGVVGGDNVACNGKLYTGGLSFYDTHLTLSNSSVLDSKAEDGIHIMNSQARLESIHVENSQSDAIDIDFCLFQAARLRLVSNKGDGLDTSGSRGWVRDSVFENNQDKNISIGENSKLDVSGSFFKGGNYGVAVKDGSAARIIDSDFSLNNHPIALYVKKSYFPRPSLQWENLRINGKAVRAPTP